MPSKIVFFVKIEMAGVCLDGKRLLHEPDLEFNCSKANILGSIFSDLEILAASLRTKNRCIRQIELT